MIVPPSFLFQYQLSVPRVDGLPKKKGKSLQLPDTAKVFVPSSLNDETAGKKPASAGPARVGSAGDAATGLELKLGWNPQGLAIEIVVRGKKEEFAGRRHDLKNSDVVYVFIDTRHTANVHRATEFCTALQILPSDEAAEDEPTLAFVEIAQQRGTRRQPDAKRVMVNVQNQRDGYQLELWIPTSQMPGFEQIEEIGHLGFYVVVEDTELGQLPLSIGDDFPVTHDPSAWLQLNLA